MPSRLCPRSLIVLPLAAAVLSGCAQSDTPRLAAGTTPTPAGTVSAAPAPAAPASATAAPATAVPDAPETPPVPELPADPADLADLAPPPAAESPAAEPPAAAPAAPVPASPADPLANAPALEKAPEIGAPTCRSGDLSVTHADSVYTPGSVQEVFVVRTTGADCQLTGYPTLRLLDADGSPLAVRVRQGGGGLPARPASPVALGRTTSVSFLLATGRAEPCTDAAAASVTLPGAPAALRTTADLQVCGGAAAVSALGRLGDDETHEH